MSKETPAEDLVDFIDLINFTLSNEFVQRWKYKYSERFIKIFQLKLLQAVSDGSCIKINSLYRHMTKTYKYSKAQTLNFFESIQIEDFAPMIVGKLKE